jgi:hypothetical protein
VRSSEFLLPEQARLKMVNDEGLESDNHSSFSGCHEFVGESKLSFDDVPSASDANAALDRPLEIPPHQLFTTTLAQDVDTAHAAAGDVVVLKTGSAIRTNASEIRLPKNSMLKARVIRLQFSYGAPARMSMVMALESAEVGGKSIPISAQAESINGKMAPMSVIDHGNVAFISMVQAKPGYVLKHGFGIRWRSVSASPEKPQAGGFSAECCRK